MGVIGNIINMIPINVLRAYTIANKYFLGNFCPNHPAYIVPKILLNPIKAMANAPRPEVVETPK